MIDNITNLADNPHNNNILEKLAKKKSEESLIFDTLWEGGFIRGALEALFLVQQGQVDLETLDIIEEEA